MFSNGCERAPSVSNIIQRLIVMIVMVMVMGIVMVAVGRVMVVVMGIMMVVMVMVIVMLGARRVMVMVMVMGIMVVAVGRMIAGTQQVTDSGDSIDDNSIAETMIMTITMMTRVMMLGSVGEL